MSTSGWGFGMRSRISICALVWISVTHAAPLRISGTSQGVREALASVGIVDGMPARQVAHLRVVVGQGYGFRPTAEQVTVRRIVDEQAPKVEIYWGTPQKVARYQTPADAHIFARERWTGAPVMAGLRRGSEAVLWLAVDAGPLGYERFPYLAQAVAALGVEPLVESRDLWAFADPSYRLRADPERLARNWRKAGIAAIHVAAWQYWEPDAARDRWLARLIEICHRNAILVYAWIELPHVSEQFWQDHPEWREKTGLLTDAHLDWRKLMNLQNADCSRAVERDLRALARRFPWDGINLGELYFESLEGVANPARFTPLNADVRREFQDEAGFDPIEIFRERSRDGVARRRFLDYRLRLARRMQGDWVRVLDSIRQERNGALDLVLTHVDDRFDVSMRDLVAADAAGVLPLLDQHDMQFLIEDPATVWHLGPKRYPEIARRYRELTRWQDRLAIDINIVERYQDVYPTKQQTGVELFQLVHLASEAFARVALYFENSILPVDAPLLASAAATARVREDGAAWQVECSRDCWVRWAGGATVNGRVWPAVDASQVRLPAGQHRLEPGLAPPFRLVDLNARLEAARQLADGGLELTYTSRTTALVRVSAAAWVEADGQRMGEVAGEAHRLPPGRHTVRLYPEQHVAPFSESAP